MSTSEPILPVPPAARRWLWSVRILAVLSIVFIGVLIIVSWPRYFEPAVLI